MISVRLGNRATLDHVALGLMVFVIVGRDDDEKPCSNNKDILFYPLRTCSLSLLLCNP